MKILYGLVGVLLLVAVYQQYEIYNMSTSIGSIVNIESRLVDDTEKLRSDLDTVIHLIYVKFGHKEE